MFGRDNYLYVVPTIVFGTLTIDRAISTLFVLTARLSVKQMQLFGVLSIIGSIFAIITGVSTIVMGDAASKQNADMQKTIYISYFLFGQGANSILTIILYIMLFLRIPLVMKVSWG